MMGFGMQWYQLYHMQTICTSLQTDNHTNTSSLNFYRLDALPAVQLSVKALKAQCLQSLCTKCFSFVLVRFIKVILC